MLVKKKDEILSSVYVPGTKIGRVTVLEEVASDNKTRLLKCKCSCGSVRIVSSATLKNHFYNKSYSCGCVMYDELDKIFLDELKRNKKFLDDFKVAHSYKAKVRSSKRISNIVEELQMQDFNITRKTSTKTSTGVRGVFLTGRGDYKVQIFAIGELFYIGRYYSLIDAVTVRRNAEKKIYGKAFFLPNEKEFERLKREWRCM